ncbi:MAG: cupredoxin family protein [Alcaligenaceae bacterium]|nr:cupredoxin family protein [Alcaligenaceae bacterium]
MLNKTLSIVALSLLSAIVWADNGQPATPIPPTTPMMHYGAPSQHGAMMPHSPRTHHGAAMPHSLGAHHHTLTQQDSAADHTHEAEHTHAAEHSHTNYGEPGKVAEVDHTIEITMSEMRFNPDKIQVKTGETIRFVVKNIGALAHELVIGSMDELMAHAEEMRLSPHMVHDEPNMITLNPGQTGELIWKFSQSGTVDFACLIPGHVEGGMIGQLNVIAE